MIYYMLRKHSSSELILLSPAPRIVLGTSHVTRVESQTDTQMHITRSHTLQTASLSKINDA